MGWDGREGVTPPSNVLVHMKRTGQSVVLHAEGGFVGVRAASCGVGSALSSEESAAGVVTMVGTRPPARATRCHRR